MQAVPEPVSNSMNNVPKWGTDVGVIDPWSDHNRVEVTPCGKYYICHKGKLYKSYEHMNAVRRKMSEDHFKASVEKLPVICFYSNSCLIDWFAAIKSCSINEWGQCPFGKSSRLALFLVLEPFDWIIVFNVLPHPLCVILTKSTGSNNRDKSSVGATTNNEQIAFFQNADEIDKRSNQLDEESYQVEKIMGVKTQKDKKNCFW